jgi:ABC-type phosphate transport system auxiliary subunit
MMDDFDFGFSAVSEDELDTAINSKKVIEESEATVEELRARLQELYDAVMPLLNNLRANPEKEYILWKDRVPKIDAFETKLTEIVNRD